MAMLLSLAVVLLSASFAEAHKNKKEPKFLGCGPFSIDPQAKHKHHAWKLGMRGSHKFGGPGGDHFDGHPPPLPFLDESSGMPNSPPPSDMQLPDAGHPPPWLHHPHQPHPHGGPHPKHQHHGPHHGHQRHGPHHGHGHKRNLPIFAPPPVLHECSEELQFGQSCNQFNECYGTCNVTKKECDDKFRDAMVDQCDQHTNSTEKCSFYCNLIATANYGAAKFSGADLFENMQTDANCDSEQ